MTEDWQNGGFGLYVHWPFCEAKCPYCDFNSHVVKAIDQKAWQHAYLRELDRVALFSEGRVLNSIFFGGGTPSLMDTETAGLVIEKARKIWKPANDLEVTLEANPGSVEATRFSGYRDAGVNRISMGIQALNDPDLKRLGRLHSSEEAKAAFDIARREFQRVSFDLIYARQGQTLADWTAELKEALSMSVDHLSLYQLTIETGTAFGDRYEAGKLKGLPDDSLSADMYMATQEVCSQAGMPRYEVSNHAAAGAESRHNMVYWRYGDYIGIGPGAHGRVTKRLKRYATEAISHPGLWLKSSETRQAETVCEALTGMDQAEELLLMGLRINEGVDLHRFEALAGVPLNRTGVARLQDWGLVTLKNSRLSVSDQGVKVLNSILVELLRDQVD